MSERRHEVRVRGRLFSSRQRVRGSDAGAAVNTALDLWPGRAVTYRGPVDAFPAAASPVVAQTEPSDPEHHLPNPACPVSVVDDPDVHSQTFDCPSNHEHDADPVTRDDYGLDPWSTGYGSVADYGMSDSATVPEHVR